jgi:hypothetical protein
MDHSQINLEPIGPIDLWAMHHGPCSPTLDPKAPNQGQRTMYPDPRLRLTKITTDPRNGPHGPLPLDSFHPDIFKSLPIVYYVVHNTYERVWYLH